MKRALYLAAAAALYMLAAWQVAPGFYDGIAPPEPYRWVSPPPQIQNPGPPLSGKATIKVTRGVVDPGTAFTDDGQAMLSFVPGAFRTPTDSSTVSIQIRPVAGVEGPPNVRVVTNTYQVTASQTLKNQAVITLRYSDQLPAPSQIFVAEQAGSWQSLGATSNAAPYTISANTSALGYFVAGYPSNTTPPPGAARVSGGQLIPILVAGVILLVVLAGAPLAVLRRRSTSAEGGKDSTDRR